jgi:BolA protein
MSVAQSIRDKLAAALQPTRLEVINESHLHAGHAGSPGTGESHYRVLIVSPLFAGKTRLERHRLVNATLVAELTGNIHALAIAAYAPGETDARGKPC